MNYKRLALSLAAPQFAGIIGSFFTVSAITSWYAFLEKPVFNPPSWLFGPVWVALYFLMGVSVYLVWQSATEDDKEKMRAVNLFWMHLFINAVWSIIFFGLKSPGFAFLDIIILWIFIIILIFKFWNIKKMAALLLIPYFLWVSFASLLNFYIWYLN